MVKAEASTTLNHPVEEVWRFISDWDNFEKWFMISPGEEINKTSEGPIALGSTIQLKGRFLGRAMVVEARVFEFEQGRRIGIEYLTGAFKGSKKSFTLEPGSEDDKTKLTHTSIGEFRGLWRIPGLLLRFEARRGLAKTNKAELDKVSASFPR